MTKKPLVACVACFYLKTTTGTPLFLALATISLVPLLLSIS